MNIKIYSILCLLIFNCLKLLGGEILAFDHAPGKSLHFSATKPGPAELFIEPGCGRFRIVVIESEGGKGGWKVVRFRVIESLGAPVDFAGKLIENEHEFVGGLFEIRIKGTSISVLRIKEEGS